MQYKVTATLPDGSADITTHTGLSVAVRTLQHFITDNRAPGTSITIEIVAEGWIHSAACSAPFDALQRPYCLPECGEA